jgi:catechol 2,3-dioxygenase
MEAARAPIDPTLRVGSVKLAVSDLPRSADFYERVLGLPLLYGEQNGGAGLGGDRGHPLLELTGLSHPTPAPPGRTGLFHVAWLHPSRAALAETVRRIAGSRWPIDGASDHGVSEALYLSDPDGLGIEIYADRPREQWKTRADGHGFEIVTLPLDLEDLLAQAPEQPGPVIAPEVVVGHVHLKVSDVPRSAAFYRDTLGFSEQAQLPSAAFLSAGGYHHHVGLNSWQSQGAGAPSEDAPGLRAVEFELGDADALAALEQRLIEAPGGPPASLEAKQGRVSLRDPDGNRLVFGPPARETQAESRQGSA